LEKEIIEKTKLAEPDRAIAGGAARNYDMHWFFDTSGGFSTRLYVAGLMYRSMIRSLASDDNDGECR
jgi:hypothetical protein